MRCLRRGTRGSVVLVMSRWHPKDPVGLRELRFVEEWEKLHCPAIRVDDEGVEHAFAPEVVDIDTLRRIREEERERDPTDRLWWARFQGSPIVVGGSKFKEDVPRYTEIPPWSFRIGFGLDLAFTTEDGSDYCAFVVMKIVGKTGYILDVQRHKLETHLIESTCRALMNKYERGPFFAYVSGPEVGTVKLLRERGIPIMPMKARYNKLVRAERACARWNANGIHLPRTAPWLNGFLSRVEIFTGHEKARDDDEIDALAAVHDGMFGSSVGGGSGPKTAGKTYAGLLG
jgi:predicted phage terminase large subunit-like protein